jgi:hypothetical protein
MRARHYVKQICAGLWRVTWDHGLEFHFRTRRGALRFACALLKEQQ